MTVLTAASRPSWAQADKVADDDRRVRVHTTREDALIGPLLRLFERMTQIRVDVTYLAGDPIERLTADAAEGSVDLFIGSEFGQLLAAKSAGVTASVGGSKFADVVPAGFRDPDGHWFGLTRRMRVLAVASDRVDAPAVAYEDLATPAWKGRICMRSGAHPYNVALMASMIAHKGASYAESWLTGLKANLARAPKGGDRDQIAGVLAGACDIAVVNTYYVAGAMSAHSAQPGAAGGPLRIVVPNAKDRGAHTSISGMALVKGAQNADNARFLMDFLLSRPAQFYYAQDNFEYPIRSDVKASPALEAWGAIKEDDIPLGKLAGLLPEASRLVTKVGFDDTPGPRIGR